MMWPVFLLQNNVWANEMPSSSLPHLPVSVLGVLHPLDLLDSKRINKCAKSQHCEVFCSIHRF